MTSVIQLFLMPLSPILCPVVASIGLILAECAPRFVLHRTKFLLAFAGTVGSLFFCWRLWRAWPIAFVMESFTQGQPWLVAFGNSFHLDVMVLALFVGIAVFTAFSLVFIDAYFKESEVRTEVFALTLIVSAGMMLLVSANSLLMIFLSLELLSLPTYILVGIKRKDVRSSEAALKYFLFGSFATVLLVLGIAFLYAQLGTLDLGRIAEILRRPETHTPAVITSVILFLVTIAFKVGAVPFHMWVPDAYEGAPTPITGFMGSAVKISAFGLAIHLFWGVLEPLRPMWSPWIMAIAVATMFLGNLVALVQDNLKRLFAYSSISHAGYLLVALTSAPAGQFAEVHIYYYLLAYGVMFLGAFGILMLVEQASKGTEISSISGIGFSQPLLGGALAVFALSAAGIPPTAGFLAKYFILLDVVRTGNTWLVVLAVLSSLIGVYYYLRVIVHLYMREPRGEVVSLSANRMVKLVILLCVAALAYLTVFPIVRL